MKKKKNSQKFANELAKGLMLAGLITPSSQQDIIDKETLDAYDKAQGQRTLVPEFMPPLQNEPIPFKVVITGFSHANKWYKDQVGKQFEVIEYLEDYLLYADYKARDFIWHFIEKTDCKKVTS